MPLTVYRAALPLAIAYFVAGGVLALWFPADGLDLRVSFVAGRAALDGVSPYDRAAYIRTWQSLPTPPELATTVAFPFAYPPTWIPLCLALALLPWGAALVAWKLLNVAFLVGSVLLTFRLLHGYALTASDRYAGWCFALVLSPTISVMAIGQASLFVLFMLVSAGYALQQRRPTLAGVALALALTKPQMAVPFVLFLVLQGAIGTLMVAAACVASLAALGLWLSHSDLGTYLSAIGIYADFAEPTSHVAVGLASLLAHLSALGAGRATLIGAIVGVALTAFVSFRTRARQPLPALLYLGPLAFHCNSYDLVALIPLFAWSRVAAVPAAVRATLQGLCLVLILPRAGIRLVYQTLAGHLAAEDAYRLVELTFRSWVLVLMLPLVLAALLKDPPAPDRMRAGRTAPC